MSKPTLILIIVLFFFTGGLLILALNKSFYNPKDLSQPIQSVKPVIPTSNVAVTASDAAVAETSLLFGNLSIASSSSYPKIYSLPIIINTGTNKVTSVQLELSFDPNILTKVNIIPSTFFKNPNVIINKINNDIGKISYALSKTASESASPVHATERGKQGEGTLAKLTFESKFSSAASAITFLSRTFVTAEGLDSSALKSTNSAEFKFSN